MTFVIRPCRPQSTCFRTAVLHWCKVTFDINHHLQNESSNPSGMPRRRISSNDVVTKCRLSLEGRLKTWAQNYHTSENPKVNVCNFCNFKLLQNLSKLCEVFINAMNWLQFWRCNMAYLPAPLSSFLVLMSPHIQQVCLRQRLTIQKSCIRQSSKYADIGHKLQEAWTCLPLYWSLLDYSSMAKLEIQPTSARYW